MRVESPHSPDGNESSVVFYGSLTGGAVMRGSIPQLPTDPPPAAESDVQSNEVSEEVKGRKTDCDDFYYYTLEPSTSTSKEGD